MDRRPPLDDIGTEISSIFGKSLFSSVRTIVHSLGIPASTEYWHFIEKIGFKNYLLQRVPRGLTDELRRR
jgi:hypothetical protein